MAEPLTAQEAYRACLEDYDLATARAKYAVDHQLVSREKFGDVMVAEFTHLWQRRIDSGELPPILPPCAQHPAVRAGQRAN